MSNRYNVQIIIVLRPRVALYDNLTKCDSDSKIKMFLEFFDEVTKNLF